MAEELIIVGETKEQKFIGLIPQVKGLIEGENNAVANMANICAALKQTFGFFWVGFYLVDNNELVLGPFQGPVACTRIAKGRGVCGKSWEDEKSILVPNVDEFPGHIACSSDSKSEIVIPVFKENEVVAILDVDSELLNHFDDIDEKYLTDLCKCFSNIF